MASPSSQSTTPLSASTPPSTPPALGDKFHHPLQGAPSAEHYKRWRPSFHLQPASGWLNDPCAPGFDPTTGLYHVSFQWNPNGPDWGDISWGSATSTDMVHWTINDSPTLSPETDYDGKGVFTGCSINARDGALVYAYTSVSALPIHHTLPHPRGCETLSLARSIDAGRTWEKVAANPILPCEPDVLDVTGWRDPYVSRWPRMAETLDLDNDQTLFGIISGGIRGATPTTFLYAIDADDLTQWRYIGPLVDFGLNLRPSRWSGDLGRNWEVTNFLSLRDEHDASISRDFLVMGTEGCVEDVSGGKTQALARPCRGQLWMSGTLRKTDAEGKPAADMSYAFGGHLDHGCLYAANSFFDPQTQTPVVWGWIPEDDLCDELRHAQGWSGMLSMPRDIRMQTLRHVIGASSSSLQDITSIEVERDNHGSSTIRTLSSEPLRSLVRSLRCGPNVRHSRLTRSRLGCKQSSCGLPPDGLRTHAWELRCSIKVARGCRKVGLRIGHSEDYSSSTKFTFDPTRETFTIDRSALPTSGRMKSEELVNSRPEVAPHTLFTTKDPGSGVVDTEPLEIRAWRDNSVLEVFVNGRTAISTRVYAADATFGLQFFAEGADDGVAHLAELVSADVWDGIGLA